MPFIHTGFLIPDKAKAQLVALKSHALPPGAGLPVILLDFHLCELRFVNLQQDGVSSLVLIWEDCFENKVTGTVSQYSTYHSLKMFGGPRIIHKATEEGRKRSNQMDK